jgi:hypothetical protein
MKLSAEGREAFGWDGEPRQPMLVVLVQKASGEGASAEIHADMSHSVPSLISIL